MQAIASFLPAAAPPVPAPSGAEDDGWDFSFHNLLGILNPLQHLPVIGTLYRAVTGDTIGLPEKVAGDALYGGLWGAVSGLADAAFEMVTGKDVGDTVLALFTGGGDAKPVAVAVADNRSAAPALPPSAAIDALSDAMAKKGIDPDTARRALYAYRRTVTQPQGVLVAASS